MAYSIYTNDDFLNMIIIYTEFNRLDDKTSRLFAMFYPNLTPWPSSDRVKEVLKNTTRIIVSFKNYQNQAVSWIYR